MSSNTKKTFRKISRTLTFQAFCVKPLEPKFSIKDDRSSLHDGMSTMSKNLSFSLQVKQLRDFIESKAMQSVFYIVNIDPKTKKLMSEDTVYLLQNYSSVNIDQVSLSVEHYIKYSTKEIDSENLLWTTEPLVMRNFAISFNQN
jgi:hypothetical protein